jgi:hypothetical protein
MAAKFRTLAAARVRDVLSAEVAPSQRALQAAMSPVLASGANDLERLHLRLPLRALGVECFSNNLVEKIETDHLIDEVSIGQVPVMMTGGKGKKKSPKTLPKKQTEPALHFWLRRERFVYHSVKFALGVGAKRTWGRLGVFSEEPLPSRVAVEFSSPNVAKPFHMGHLRSTIIGAFAANICEAVGHDVQRLNWLGDWGTQFGLLLAGLKREGLDNLRHLDEEPLRRLHACYVAANAEAERDPDFAAEARRLAATLEMGQDEQLMQMWRDIRDVTVKELEKTYDRLGVYFDDYHGEAMYASGGQQEFRVEEALRQLREIGLLQKDEHGKQVAAVTYGSDQRQVRVENLAL